VRAFNAGLAPLTLGLLLSTGWILSEPARDSIGAVVLVAVTVLVMVKTRVSPMWLIALGAIAGMLGLA
jgi:chromate transporter